MARTNSIRRPRHFKTDLVFKETHPNTDRPYTISQNLVFNDLVIHITVPAGFRFDRASIPSALEWLANLTPLEILPSKAVIDYAAAVHDYLYREGYDRKVADAIFHMICRADKANRFQSWLAYKAVRDFGWLAWKGKKNGS